MAENASNPSQVPVFLLGFAAVPEIGWGKEADDEMVQMTWEDAQKNGNERLDPVTLG